MRYLLLISILTLATSAKGQPPRLQDSLRVVLEDIKVKDQFYRSRWDSVLQQYGYNSPEFFSLMKKMNTQDSINLIQVRKILDTHGWLGAAETSVAANDALFLTIQHSPIDVQLQYLPVMKKAVDAKKARAADFALLVDRTNMHQGKFQVYGSQLVYDASGKLHFFPIEDEPNVDKRRKSVDLPPLSEYVKMFNQPFTYAPPSTDLYKDKIVIKGSIINTEGRKPIPEVSVYLGKNLLIGKSDANGFFQLILDEKYRGWSIMFRKEKFESAALTLDNNSKDVYDLNPVLKEIKK